METGVPRLERLSPGELDERYLLRGQPVVLTRAIEDWPARKKWSFSYFKEVFGERELRVRGGSRRSWRLLCRVDAATYLDSITGAADSPLARFSADCPYAAFNRLDTCKEDVDFESLVASDYRLTAAHLWIGPANSLTPLHYDASGLSAFVQLVGRKHFVLYPFEDSPSLYPSDIFDYQSVFSAVNIDAPDLCAHPDFPRARKMEVTVEAGEVLFIPNKMWHQVRAVDNSISVTRRMKKNGTALSIENAIWKAKAALHLCGLYKRMRCLCHIDEPTPADIAVHHPWIRAFVRAGLVPAHGRDLSELIGWS